MILFLVICALMIGLALLFILPPLRHPDRIAPASTVTEANVAVYRRQLAEMEMEPDLRHRVITNEQFLQDREDLEQRLLVDLPKDAAATRQESPEFGSEMLVYTLVGLVLTAVLLYLALGTPSLLHSP